MSDIVERLFDSDEAAALTNEAARYIERLERENAELRDGLDLVEVDLTAGDISAPARVQLALHRVRAFLDKEHRNG